MATPHFADQKNTERGRVMCGGNWFTPQTVDEAKSQAAMVASARQVVATAAGSGGRPVARRGPSLAAHAKL
jgi:hypothetical protein